MKRVFKCPHAYAWGLMLGCSGPADAPAPVATTPTEEVPAEEVPLDYPRGPYGMKVGQVFADFELEGLVDGRQPWTTIRLRDLYDPRGEKGITAIYLSIGAVWCPSCQGEGASLPKSYPAYRDKGARFVSVLVHDGAHKPATRATIESWVEKYGTNYDIAADPTFASIPNASSGGSIALPYDMAIDPRTMRVTYVKSGPIFLGTTGMPGVDELVKKNGG